MTKEPYESEGITGHDPQTGAPFHRASVRQPVGEERYITLRTAYTAALATNMSRIRELVALNEQQAAEIARLLTATNSVTELNNLLVERVDALNALVAQRTGLLLNLIEGKTATLSKRDLAMIDGGEVLSKDNEDGSVTFTLKLTVAG